VNIDKFENYDKECPERMIVTDENDVMHLLKGK